MSRKISMPVFWSALGCAVALASLAGFSQRSATFNSYEVPAVPLLSNARLN
jgi:hypothetical protein